MKDTPLRSGSGRDRTSSGRAVPELISVSSPCWHDITTNDNGPNQFAAGSYDSAGKVSGATFSRFEYQQGVVLPAGRVIAPQIGLKDLSTINQDVCKNESLVLSCIGAATN